MYAEPPLCLYYYSTNSIRDIMEFSIAKMKEIIKDQGDKRVSEDSAEELRRVLEMFAGDVSEEAIAIARENDRKTVRAEDIREALR